MSEQHLAVYLNDHLAGSTAALELLAELHTRPELKEWVAPLKADITADRQELESLMRRLRIAQSSIRQAAAWMSEKLAELKTRIDDTSGGALQLLEWLEALALGIDGKRSLWVALQTAAEKVPALQGPDYARLIKRAEQQRQIVEARRLATALDAFQAG